MLVVKTNFPNETLKIISDDYLINDNYIMYSSIDEIDDEYIASSYPTRLFKNKLILMSPLLVLTNSEDVIDYLSNIYIFDEVKSNESEFFIRSGFLPLNEQIISSYMKENITPYTENTILSENEYYVFKMFKEIGYLDERKENSFEPSSKLINSLIDTEYCSHLTFLKNNFDESIWLNRKYISSMYEILKLIDINIIMTVEKQKNL